MFSHQYQSLLEFQKYRSPIITKGILTTTGKVYFNSIFTVSYDKDCIKPLTVCLDVIKQLLNRGNILEKKESITE